ncbi:PDZ domain containing protein [Nitzschia inconspicua]|uniref:PDZ domain containing protein n=1 Tax=Nitzschia inconspicua TaxID=303405 RepID=A0A9K3Q0W7_9STRA|nr:PDZ domain containing protein [Nitzschia inconspicua]
MHNHCQLLFWLSLMATTCSVVHSQENVIIIDPWELPPVNAPYENVTAVVGDTISFAWPEGVGHTVFINPSGSCDDSESVFLGNTSPVNYTFTAADVTQSPLFIADNINELCENGMGFFVVVIEATDAPAPVASPVATQATDSPTAATDPPVAAPVVATESPTVPPPTPAPVTPTPAPVAPTEAPVAPTEPPIIPTEPPVAPTEMPTEMPVDTSEPSAAVAPSAKPSLAPTQPGSIVQTLTGLRMGLAGITSMPQSTQTVWAQATKEFSESFVLSELSTTVTNFATTYTVTDVSPVAGQRNLLRGGQQRQLQQQAVIIDFDQRMQFDTTDPSVTALDLAQNPFLSPENKGAYLALLRSTGDLFLLDVAGVSNVVIPPSEGPTSPPSDDEPVLSTPAIIGIACGGGALLILIVLYFLYCRGSGGGGGGSSSRKSGKEMSHGGDDEPPLHVNVRDDEVSTLAGPMGPPTYGDQSVATVDYDYSKAYGGAGDTSVSSAGGTFGSNTQNQSALDPRKAAATGAALGALPMGDAFDPGFRDANNVKEEIIHIFAPPGKLGVVIDTPDDGAPVVHAVKDSSVIADKIQVGDKLVAVDDEDVRSMTAIKVSKLISRKSANPSRKLTVIRTILLE